MPSSLYRMPPLPVKRDLLRQFLTGPHSAELFVGSTGQPVFALIMSTESVGERESRMIQHLLRFVNQLESDQWPMFDRALVQGTKQSQGVFQLRPGLVVDLEHYEVRRDNVCIPLRAREADLLQILLRHPRIYMKAEMLAEAIGSESADEPEHPIEEMMSNIRRKLGETPYHPSLIRCKRLAGYAIFPEEPRSSPSDEAPRDQEAS